MELEVRKINDKIMHVKFSSQRELTETLIRYSEYYESPSTKFRGKIFTLGQIRKWYSKENGSFSYNHDYAGFNLPSIVLHPFKDGLFDPLTDQEQEFLKLFRDRGDKFYIIGTCTGDDEEEYRDHELLHALYYVSRRYREKVNKVLKGQKLERLFACLKKQGYCSDKTILIDEVQAYLGSDPDIFDENEVKYFKEVSIELKKIAKTFLRRLK